MLLLLDLSGLSWVLLICASREFSTVATRIVRWICSTSSYTTPFQGTTTPCTFASSASGDTEAMPTAWISGSLSSHSPDGEIRTTKIEGLTMSSTITATPSFSTIVLGGNTELFRLRSLYHDCSRTDYFNPCQRLAVGTGAGIHHRRARWIDQHLHYQ